MPNIFDGLKILEDDVIIENIAMLEAVTMGSVFKGYGTTVANKGAKLVNKIGGLFGKNPEVKVVEEKRIEDYIKEEKDKIRYLDREKLDEKLIEVLKERTDINMEASEDTISATVINSVSKHMKLGENMTIAQKADGIHRRYLEKLLNNIQKQLKSQSEDEAEKTIEEINKNVEALSDKDKEELKKVFNVEKLTGKEIRSILMKAGAPTAIIATLSASGFGAFMALTTIIHAIFTTILGVTLPFAVYTGATSALSFILGPAGLVFIAGTTIWQFTKGNKNLKNEIMGQLIFASVNSYGGSFVAKDKDLPSHESNPLVLQEMEKRDEEYKNLVEDNRKLQKKVGDLEEAYKKSQNDIHTYENRIRTERDKRQKSENEISKLNLEKQNIDKYLSDLTKSINILENKVALSNDESLRESLEKSKQINKKYEIQLKKLNENIRYQNQIIEHASSEIEEKTRLIMKEEERNIKLQKENRLYEEQIKAKDERIEKTENVRKREILEKWTVYYPDFEIKPMAIRDASKFSKKELWEIERALIELHSLKDYKSVSRGKIKDSGNEYEHIGLSLPCGFPTRILYKINNNSVKRVTIEKIYKHNERFYN